MAKDVFISYSSLNADKANAVCAALETAGIACWIAPRDIAPGADWSERIIAGLHECRVFVLVLTAQSNASPQVKREVERAVHRDIPIIAFLLENLTLTPALEYFISTNHWLSAVSPPLEPHLDRLRQAVQEALQSSPAPAIADPPAPPVPPVAPVSVVPPAIPAGNLPTHATAFVGREREVKLVEERLEEGARLVTLTGLGGIGKTRIALRVAEDRRQRYLGGTWWVDLSVIDAPDRMLPAIAATLGMNEEPGRPLKEQMAQHLRQTDTLLVLDNFEQIIAAAEELDDLLHACPRLVVLVTSSATLNISMAYEVAVQEMTSAEAVELFCLRAQKVKAGFQLDEKSLKSVEAICRHLDGIPLAIELAATQIRMLGVAQLEKQLGQRFRMLVSPYKDVAQRQRTLKATLDWSYDLLTEEQQQLFAHLSIFRNGFTLEDAEAICLLDDVYFGLAALREQSLLRLEESEEETRFSMLETLREYGREKLQAARTLDAVAERHALYYAEMARQQGHKLRETGDAATFTLISNEADNLREALDWLWKNARYADAVEMAVNLRHFWERKGWLREGQANMDLAEPHLDQISDPIIRARVYRASGWFAYLLGDLKKAETLTRRSYEISVEADVSDIQASVLNNLALIAREQLEFENATQLFEQSVAIYRKLGNDKAAADLLMNLGLLHSTQGNHDAAQQLFEEARTIYERHSDATGVAGWLCNQSDLALRRCNWKEAEIFAEQSLQRFRQINHRRGIAIALTNLADAAARLGQHMKVDDIAREAYSICAETNLYFLIPILLVAQVRSQQDRQLIGSAVTSLVAAQRLRTLLNLPLSPEERSDITLLEQELQLADQDNRFHAAEAKLAGASVDEIIRQLISRS
jgi:predicted ATPase/Tfp pilus assembly protein PilF